MRNFGNTLNRASFEFCLMAAPLPVLESISFDVKYFPFSVKNIFQGKLLIFSNLFATQKSTPKTIFRTLAL